MGCPDVWPNSILSVSVFGAQPGIGSSGLRAEDGPPGVGRRPPMEGEPDRRRRRREHALRARPPFSRTPSPPALGGGPGGQCSCPLPGCPARPLQTPAPLHLHDRMSQFPTENLSVCPTRSPSPESPNTPPERKVRDAGAVCASGVEQVDGNRRRFSDPGAESDTL